MTGRSKDVAAAYSAVAVTKSDSTVLPTTRSLFIGTAGDVAVVMADGTSATFKNIASASVLPVQVTKVMSTSTTAADIVALY